MGLTEFFGSLGAWNWFIVAVILFVLETIVPGVHFIWFGVAAAIVGVLGLAVDIAWEWQLITFAIISCVTVFLARRFAGPDVTRSDEPDLNVRAAQYVGRVVTVEDPIAGAARCASAIRCGPRRVATPRGARVRVTGTNGCVLLVEHAAS